ncbi:MAG TPA: roadblock/LC7 domain-containing protein [Gemmatimonadales bacterium]|nr:roadblock/LC7 domain-containing protein [Gemmatimonadales bacterium]
MSELSEVVRGLARREGIESVVLASADGLPIDHAGSISAEPEALAALAATMAQHATRLGEAAGRGELTTAVMEYRNGLAVLALAGEGNCLILLAAADTNLGPLLYDLRRHRPALSSLL